MLQKLMQEKAERVVKTFWVATERAVRPSQFFNFEF
ncbi:hypothetical protein E2C01_024221 [Portunus trituberculatus]|uniref:Uncharacterized protein n=1 Tax=Portunus trituberculatus TaxID=210409 RepID=A0A5B7ECA3_PORTR|nr:hypothetical protein [Portunus trituberculatus]